jgi:hypothetical protein
MLEGLELEGLECGESAVLGALFGPGRGEGVAWEGRFEVRPEGDWGKPDKERDNLCIGGGTKKGLAVFSGSPGEGEASARDIGIRVEEGR